MLPNKKKQALLLSSLFAAVQMLPPLAAVAQAPGAPADAGGSGPIDIQAHEQEFTGDHVVAKGNVKVLYKDTVILAPLATLYRDLASGQPQKAIFTGHPRLTQGANKIDADQLIFEMTTSKIYAEGHAHSEVVNNEPAAEPIADKKKGGMPPKAGMVPNGKGGFEWPTQESDRKKAQAQKKEEQEDKVISEEKLSDASGKSTAGDSESQPAAGSESGAPSGSPAGGAVAGAAGGPAGGAQEAPTKIITDSDRQEYDRDSGRFEAFGNVRVIAGDIHVTADKLKLAYGIDHRPEAAIFTGHVNAIQGKNNTISDFMTYFLNTKRLQASGHVRSKVIQEKNEAKPVPKKQEEGVIKPIANVSPANSKKNNAPVIGLNGLSGGESQAPIIIVSDSQDYNKETGRLDAIGNAKIFYEDTIGIGPKVVLMKNADGQAEKIVFVGRSQVTQRGKRWIGDRVTILVADRRVLAEGNTKAIFLQKKETPAAMPVIATKKPPVTAEAPVQNPDDANKKVAGTRVDLTE
ncbi:MAG: hypothetical protein JSS86_15130 [Cyanobacteria bacterium SZAS LIN-2]|nr:hypothetical protein [Cyanobacteria bacterium SZAS LIN-2]